MNDNLNKQITIINVDAPELRTFLVNILPFSKSVEIASLKKNNLFKSNIAKWKRQLNLKIVDIKIRLYPTLVRIYQKTIMRNELIHGKFREVWRSRKAVRIIRNTEVQSLFNQEVSREPDNHILVKSLNNLGVVVIVASDIEKHSFSFLSSNSSQFIFLLDYSSIQRLRVEFGESEVIDQRAFKELPGFWGHKFEHGTKSKIDSGTVFIICDVAPVLSLESIDHLLLEESAIKSGMKTLIFAYKDRLGKVEDFVSDAGVSFKFIDISDVELGSTQKLILELDNCTWIINFSHGKFSRIVGAAGILGIPVTSSPQRDAFDQPDLIYRISKELISRQISSLPAVKQTVTELEGFKAWKLQVLEFLK